MDFRTRSLVVCAWAIGLGSAPAQAFQELTLTRWIQAAQQEHPESRAAHWRVETVRATVPAASAWMPPQVEVQGRSDGEWSVAASQMLPGWGKRSREEQVRLTKLAMAQADSAQALRTLRLAVREAAWMEWMSHAQLALLGAQESLAVQLQESVRRNLAQGMATPTELWLASAKVRQMQIDQQKLVSESAAATRMRRYWTGGQDGPLEPGPVHAPNWEDSLLLHALAQRPDLKGMQTEIDMQRAMQHAMRAQLRPDFMVGAMAMRMSDGMAGWGIMTGVTLPFVPWARGMVRADVASAQAQERGVLARRESMLAMAQNEVLAHASKARQEWHALRALDSLLQPDQERAVADARARYAAGKEMLSMVLAMEDMVRMTKMERIMRRGAYELEKARMWTAAGLDTNEVTP